MTSPLFLGIDFGTSGCRACLIDSDGQVVAEAALALPEPHRCDTAVEQDAAIWWQGLNELLAKLPPEPLARTAALALDGTSGTVLLSDEAGTPLAPALMYNDNRAADKAERISSLSGAEAPALARTLWLLERHPEAAHIHTQADWLGYRLCGRFHCDSNNALKLGYDPVARRWPAWVGQWLDPALLPPVADAGTPVGPIDAHTAEGLGLPAGVTLVHGTTDSTAAFLATGAGKPGDAVTSLGSTLVLKVISERPISAPEYGVYSQPLGDRWLVGGASNSGGAVLRQYFSDGQMAQMSTRLLPDTPTGLDYYPLPAPGERFPINDPYLPPRLEPLSDDEVRFFQGILEGIAAIEARGYRLLAELGAPYPKHIYSVGGGAGNAVWGAIRARELKAELRTPAHAEAACGTARLARLGVGMDNGH